MAETREIYRGRLVHLVEESFRLPNGRPVSLEMVRHPGAAAIVPLTDTGEVLLVRQYRHAAGGFIYEVPAGTLQAGEAPETCAARELTEEAGVVAGSLLHLGSILTTPGFTNEVIHLYLARQLQAATQALDADELLTVETIRWQRALEMCRTGALRDAKSVCALMLADHHLHPRHGHAA